MKRQEEYFGPLAPGVRSGSIVGGSGLQGSSERRRGPGEDKRDENKIEEARKRREKERTRKGGETSKVAERTPGHRGRLFSALPEDECDRHANSGQHPCLPSNPGTQPSHGPPGPPSWSQDRRCRVGCASRHNTDPTALLEPWLSSSIPFWDLGGGVGKGGESAWPEKRE